MFSKIKSFLFINKGTGQILAKNTFWLFAGEATGRVLKLSIIIFATRKLGAENWGIFSYALSYIGLFYFLGDFGIGTFVTRELSKDNENKHKYIATALILKVSLLCLFFILTMLIAPHIGKIKLGLDIIIVLSIFFFSESIRDFAIAINRSLEKMEREALSRLIINIVTVILGIFLLIKNKDPLSLAIAYMTGSIISNYFLIWSLSNELKEIKWVFSKEKLKIIYNFSWPIIIMSFFSLIFSIDSIMLGQMKSTTEVGLYSAGQRMVQFLPVFPGFIATAIFPLLSKHEHNIQKSTYIIEKILIIVIAMAIPISFTGFLFRDEIILFLFGQTYIKGALTLGILMFSIISAFPNLILTNVIFSKNLQKIFISGTFCGTILNIILNIWLIPKYGAVGAAISTVATQFLIMLINWKKLKKFIPFNVSKHLKKVGIANIIFILIMCFMSFIGVHFILTTILSFIVYITTLYIIKEPIINDILSIRKI